MAIDVSLIMGINLVRQVTYEELELTTVLVGRIVTVDMVVTQYTDRDTSTITTATINREMLLRQLAYAMYREFFQ